MTYADTDSAKVFCGAGDRAYVGQKRHSHCPEVSGPEEKLRRHDFLGSRMLNVTTVATDEEVVLTYIKDQKKKKGVSTSLALMFAVDNLPI